MLKQNQKISKNEKLLLVNKHYELTDLERPIVSSEANPWNIIQPNREPTETII